MELQSGDQRWLAALAFRRFAWHAAEASARHDIHPDTGTIPLTNVLLVAGPNSKYREPGASPAGFWPGFWHGLVSPITFLISLFNPGVRIYEVNNRGLLYDFGFLLGASISLAGGGSQAAN